MAANAIVKMSVSVAAGVICVLAALLASFIIGEVSPIKFTVLIMIITAIVSYIVGVLFSTILYFTSENKDKLSFGSVFIKALSLPFMTVIMMFTFATVPVLFGILPPKYQSYPGETMNILGAFRGIPESMMSAIGSDSIPVAEMFYAFWGALYGQTLANSGF